MEVESPQDPKTVPTTATVTLKQIDHRMYPNIAECLKIFPTLPVTTCSDRDLTRSMSDETDRTCLAAHSLQDVYTDFDETIRRFARLHPRIIELQIYCLTT